MVQAAVRDHRLDEADAWLERMIRDILRAEAAQRAAEKELHHDQLARDGEEIRGGQGGLH